MTADHATHPDATPGTAPKTKSLAQFQWTQRVLLIFSDHDNAKASRQENTCLADRQSLSERDLVVLRIRGGAVMALFGSGADLQADEIRAGFDVVDGEFAAILIGKDGTVKLRVAEPASLQQILALIDSMPMRQAESSR